MNQQTLARAGTTQRPVGDGDLVVARKAGSALDRLIGLTADPFHHIGVVVHFPTEDGDEPWVIEHTFAGCTTRSLDAFLANYDDVGLILLPLEDEERVNVRDHATRYLGSTPRYAWDEVFLVGMSALARERRHTKESFERGRMQSALESAVYHRNTSDERAVFCTSFVLQVFRDAGLATENKLGPLAPPPTTEPIDLSPTRKDRTMHWPFLVQVVVNLGSLFSLLARSLGSVVTGVPDDPPAMCSPSDFWRQVPAAKRVLTQNDADLAPVLPMPDPAQLWRELQWDEIQRDADQRRPA